MGRAEADRLAYCKVQVGDHTHCEGGGKGGLSAMEELEVLHSHRKQADQSVGEACTHNHAGAQNCCNRYFQGVHRCYNWCHEVVHSFLEVGYIDLEERHRYLGEVHSCPQADRSCVREDHRHH